MTDSDASFESGDRHHRGGVEVEPPDSLRTDGGETDARSVDGTDRLVIDVTIRENTRSETYSDFEALMSEQFGAVYDEVECNVSVEVGR